MQNAQYNNYIPTTGLGQGLSGQPYQPERNKQPYVILELDSMENELKMLGEIFEILSSRLQPIMSMPTADDSKIKATAPECVMPELPNRMRSQRQRIEQIRMRIAEMTTLLEI